MFANSSDAGLMGEVVGRSCMDNRGEEEEEITQFYQHLIQHSQCCDFIAYLAGSTREISGQSIMLHQYGLSHDLLDIDLMMCTTSICVNTCRENAPYQFDGSVVKIYLHGQHAGYVKLFDENVERELKRTDLPPVIQGAMLQGPAETINVARCRENSGAKRFISKENWMSAKCNTSDLIPTMDHVMAVHYRYWPQEINEWITRRRLSGFPSKSIIKQVVRCGCDFVQVSHKSSTDINEWRFSFSKAELIIINNWTTSQRCVYRTLHMLNKMLKHSMEDSKLRTYYFKTLMLWATEEKPAEFWSEHVLVNSAYGLLRELMHWLERKFCPNYFIPINNMIDHLTDTELCEDIDALYQLSQSSVPIAYVLSTSIAVETLVRNRKYYIKVPVWLYTSLLILEQVKFSEYTLTNLFNNISSALIDQAISIEFSDIYHGLYYYTLAENSLIQSDNYYMMKSIEYFHCPGISDTAQATVVVCCSKTVAKILIPSIFRQYQPDTNESLLHETPNAFTPGATWNILNVDNNEADEKCLLYSQLRDNVGTTMMTDVHFNENIYGNNRTTLTVYTVSTDGSCTNSRFYKVWCHMSPTVNISWFINNAYLANLYCITVQNYRATEEICDNIIQIYKQSLVNQQFAEWILPVILSTEWTSVYDEELQAMLGLYSLCSFISNKTDHSHSVYLGVCPVQFAFYLKCRCAADQVDIEMWNKCASNEHILEGCIGSSRVHNGGWAVDASLEVIRHKFKQLIAFS